LNPKIKNLFLKNRGGQSIIEFAVLLPILLMVIFGITEFGRAILVKNVLHTAAREGARLAVVSDSTSAHGRVLEVLNAANVVPKEIIILFSVPEKKVEVTVTTDFDVLSGGILDPFMGTFELKGKTVMRLEG
jgi:Flp pilus assembly protein TadG